MGDIYAVISMVKLIVLCGFFISWKRNTNPRRLIRLIVSSIMLVSNLLQIPLLIQMGESYALTICLAVLWSINVLFALVEDDSGQ